MLRINQIKIPCSEDQSKVKDLVLKKYHIKESEVQSFEIVKKSIDARKKIHIFYVYTVDISIANEDKLLKNSRHKNIMLTKQVKYSIPKLSVQFKSQKRPLVVGAGPAGLFASYLLALSGCNPILIERGALVEQRQKDVEAFWESGTLNLNSNVQFGEGGAGTFSDGKLNTGVKDQMGRTRFILETFVKFGAPEEILYEQKPHIGTDILAVVVKNMREEIIRLGGEVHFHTQMTSLIIEDGKLSGIRAKSNLESDTDAREIIFPTEHVILALGHSARDTFETLYQQQVPMEAKSFAVGLRIMHPQKLIQVSQYGEEMADKLPPAPYKLTAKDSAGRGVYSFCMCPGGYVVNAASEENTIVVNGMSYADRGSEIANSAIVVTISPEDFNSSHPLAGIEFQRNLERKAFVTGDGQIPVQRFADFKNNQIGKTLGPLALCFKGSVKMANVREILPEFMNQGIIECMPQFDKKIKGFASDDALLAGVESRTSSPVRILRDETLQSDIVGLYPCGEGAGFAGGITSAAIDGMKVFEQVFLKICDENFTKS